MRRNLVVVRAGDQSLHPQWLVQDRNWDIIVNYFGNDPRLYRQPDIIRIDSKGPKWPALYELMGEILPQIGAYDYIWFPDDDLECTATAINAFFDACRTYQLELAQPALTPDSHIGVNITVANRAFILRYTNFIEIMAPCFSQAFFRRCWPSFNTSLSGWGLDFVWPRWINRPNKAAIIDAVRIKHTRPHGGPNYNALKERGVDPEKEFADLLAKEKIEKIHIITGGIDHNHRQLTLEQGDHVEIIKKIMAGYLPEFCNFPDLLFEIIAPILKSLQNGAPNSDKHLEHL